jgi:putative ABC transport system permease protein
MAVAVVERRREIGILKALGGRNRTIFRLFFLESMFYGAVGGILGLALGFVTYHFASPHISQNEFTAFVAGSQGIGLGSVLSISFGTLALSIVVSGISGLYPAYRASRLEPAEAVRYE